MGLVIICAYVLMSFRSPVLRVPVFRDTKVQTFILHTIENGEVDIQQLWQLRDSLGAVVFFNPEYFEPYSVIRLKKVPTEKEAILEYRGEGVSSTEYLVPSSEATKSGELSGEPLFSNGDTQIVFNRSDHTVRIRSILPYSDMRKHNGMIIYPEDDQPLANHRWIIDTVIWVSPSFSVPST